MANFRYFVLLIYILNLISKILCQFENESVTKALACMAILNQKNKGGEPDPGIYSTMMLKCFISISESLSKKILLGIEAGQEVISQKEVDKLTDYESLQYYSQTELKRKSQQLEKALRTFKKMQEDITGEKGDIDPADYLGDYDDDDDYNSETPSNVNFYSLIPKGIKGIFNVFNNYLSLFFVFVVVYFGLLMIRKINDSEKRMKKRKKQEEYEEEEEEEEYEFINNKNKKYKKK